MPRATVSSSDGGAGNTSGVSDDEGSVTTRVPPRSRPGEDVLGLGLVEAILQHEGDVVVGVGKAHGELHVRAELLEERDEGAGAVGLVGSRVERRMVLRRALEEEHAEQSDPDGAGDEGAARRGHQAAHRQHARLEVAEPLGLRGPGGRPAVPGRFEQLGGGRERGGDVGLPGGDVARVLPAVRPAWSAITPRRTRSATSARCRHRRPSVQRPCASRAAASSRHSRAVRVSSTITSGSGSAATAGRVMRPYRTSR